jgi:MFS family permease
MESEKLERRGQFSILIFISLSHAINHSFWVLIPTLSPLILREFQLTYVGAGTLFAVYLAAYGLGQLPVGMLAHRFSRSLLMGVGLMITALGMILTVLAPNFYAILAFQALAGFGGAAHHPLALYLISEAFPRGKRGRVLGVHGFASAVSFTVTPMAAVLLSSQGWRLPILAFSALAAIVGFLIMIFIRMEVKRVVTPPLDVIRLPGFRRLLAMFGLFTVGERGVINFLPLLLVFLYGLTIEEAGWWYSLFFLAGMIGQPLLGYLTDWVGWKRMAFGGLVASALLVVTIAFGWAVSPVLMLAGMAIMFMVVVHDVAATEVVPEEGRGVGYGLLYTVSIGMASVSAAATGLVVEGLGFPVAYSILALIFLLEIPLLLGLKKHY